jgi:hypothetical protein
MFHRALGLNDLGNRKGEMRNAYEIQVGKLERKIPLRRPRHGWKYNVRLVLREIGWEGMDWIHLARDRDQWWDLGEHSNEP